MAGNANSGRREKPFAEALAMELKDAGPNHRKLRMIARKLIAKAEEGDLAAIVELANRTDGKVPQQLQHTGEGDDAIQMVHKIERTLVRPNPKD